MSKFHSAASFTSAFNARYAQEGTLDLQAGADKRSDPDFGASTGDNGQKVETIQAGGVLSFSGAGKIKTATALSHFMVLGETVTKDSVLELPEADFNRMGPNGTGQVREATDEEIAAAQKATKK